jgi:CRISPR-associated endoribonuclease Cas6
MHKWLGENVIHDELSLYCFSALKGAVAGSKGLNFPQGAEWFLSFYDRNIIKNLVSGLLENPAVAWGMVVEELQVVNAPVFRQRATCLAASSILIKKYDPATQKVQHLLYYHPEADNILTHVMKRKLIAANLNPDGIHITFDKNYPNPTTKLIDINNIKNRTSICPVIITGTPEQLAFAWTVGIGHSTGVGFGAIELSYHQ